jgi:predicted alpha/beta-hydrolase family hydrolase
MRRQADGNRSIPDVLDVPTAVGPARAQVHVGERAGLVILGHGAGGGPAAPDLAAVTAALTAAGWTVAGVEQPYRVLGRRVADRAPRLDTAWREVVAVLADRYAGPLVTGGRSSGARVACRTASDVGAAAVVCLAFPLNPPWRPEVSRGEELAAVRCPVIVVQGEKDSFGGPAAVTAAAGAAAVEVVGVPGDHALRATKPVADAVLDWLRRQRLA